MNKATLKKHFINIADNHYGSDLWYSRPDMPYKESLERFVLDLLIAAEHYKHNKEIQFRTYSDPWPDGDDLDAVVGRNIRELREDRDWTRKKLAKEATLHPDFLREIEDGKGSLSVCMLMKIAETFKVPSSSLLPY